MKLSQSHRQPLQILIVVLVLSLAACAQTRLTNNQVDQAPTGSPGSEDSEPNLPPQVSPTSPTPARDQLIREGQRIYTAPRILVHSWSPNNEVLAFWSFTEQEVAIDFTQPPGTLTFANASTGEVCESSIKASYPYSGDDNIGWLSDGTLMLVNEGEMWKLRPCSGDPERIASPSMTEVFDIATSSPDRRYLVIVTEGGHIVYEPELEETHSVDTRVRGSRRGYSWSRDGKMLAVSAVLEGAEEDRNAMTWLIDVESGEIVADASWVHFDAEGTLEGPIWVSDRRVLIAASEDQGPILLSLDGTVMRVAPELFGQETALACPTDPCAAHIASAGAAVPGSDRFHLVLFGVGEESAFPPVRLYHSETEEVEELNFVRHAAFSTTGQFLLLHDFDPSANAQLWAHPVDPPGSKPQEILDVPGNSLPLMFSPVADVFAIAYEGQLRTLALPDGRLVGTWTFEGYDMQVGPWSPDGKRLAVRGSQLEGMGEALFIVDVPLGP